MGIRMNKREVLNHITSMVFSGEYIFSDDTNQLIVSCPFCETDSGHFYVNIEKFLYHCFKCKVGGSLKNEIYRNLESWTKLRRHLISTTNLKTFRISELVDDSKTLLIPIFEALELGEDDLGYSSLAVKAYKYCINRGMTRGQVADYHVSVVRFENRVYFPYWNKINKIIFYTGRQLDDIDDGVKTIEMVNSSKPLFGRHIHQWHDYVVLVEGVFDHFVTPHSYAIMGSSITQQQINQLRDDHIQRVFLLCDPDAEKGMLFSANKLARGGVKTFPVFMAGNKDPAELGWAKMANIVEQLETVQYRRSQIVRV